MKPLQAQLTAIDSLIALTMLRCSDIKPELPGCPPKPEKKSKEVAKRAA